MAAAAALRRAMALHERASDLIRIGAYRSGTDPDLDHAIGLQPSIRALLTQSTDEQSTPEQSLTALMKVVGP